MQNCVLQTIARRVSHRAYHSTPVREEDVQAILDAALQAPSANNRQPWHFSVVQDAALLARINAAARRQALQKAPDQRSARFEDEQFDVFYHAPLVIFISAPQAQIVSVDCGIAVAHMALAAQSLGLGSVILGLPREAFAGERAQQWMEALEFPAGHVFQIAIAIGQAADEKAQHTPLPGRISRL